MSLCKRVILLPVTLAVLMGSYAYAESSAVKYTPDGGAVSVKAFASGMDGFIAKPVDISQLVTTLDELLRKK